ncbi:hypothetical protein EPI10_016466 [Gossypium australe]|uniref:Uncharacterized protein n=1 Tax=Gossypium australe TaxID=47621 RepID=A0A5B6VNP4_9ROSI|nr:hypothetical protein EPI10_016466 [Gossypium australe]
MRFMGEKYLEMGRCEFMDLVQGTPSMDEYKAKFMQLSQYAPKLMAKRVHFGRPGRRVAVSQATRAIADGGDQERAMRLLCEHCNRRHPGEC